MKKEFMLYIRNAGDAKAALTAAVHPEFIKACEVYIGRLKAAGQLIAAQPLVREGCIVSRNEGGWNILSVDATKEVQVGYYHIRANSIEEAVAIAKDNPEFAYVPAATIEVRPVKIKEEETNFIYPK